MSIKQDSSAYLLDPRTMHETAMELVLNGADVNRDLIGIEVELPWFDKKNLKPLTFAGEPGIAGVLQSFQKDYGWGVKEEEVKGRVTGLTKNGACITLEPGGQIELSSAPHRQLASLKREVFAFYEAASEIAGRLGADVLPFGFHPHTQAKDCPYISERSRFAALLPFFQKEGEVDIWSRTASAQVTMSAKTPEMAIEMLQIGLAFQPVVAAMFANSPVAQGKDTGLPSWRNRALADLRGVFYQMPDLFFDKKFSLERWVDYVLDVPLCFIVREGAYKTLTPTPFRQRTGKPLPELSHLPTAEQSITHSDLLEHVTSIKPSALLKPGLLIEMRGCDLQQTASDNLTVAAFWHGLLYSPLARKKAHDLMQKGSAAEYRALDVACLHQGLNAPFQGKKAQDLARTLVAYAKEGAAQIDPEGVPALDRLGRILAAGQTPAAATRKVLAQTNGNIHRFVEKTFLFHPKAASRQEKNLRPSLS